MRAGAFCNGREVEALDLDDRRDFPDLPDLPEAFERVSLVFDLPDLLLRALRDTLE